MQIKMKQMLRVFKKKVTLTCFRYKESSVVGEEIVCKVLE